MLPLRQAPQPLWASHPLSKEKNSRLSMQNTHTSCTLHSKKRGLTPPVWNPALENTIQVQQLEQSRAQSPVQNVILDVEGGGPWLEHAGP